jgi:hypothetical protein
VKLSRNYWIGIIVVLLVTTWLGARRLNADGMWFDEWWSQYVAGADVFHIPRSIDAIWTRIVTENIREGAFYPILLAGWGSAVGWTEFATRALSLFAGLIALAGVFRLGWALGGRPLVGLSAAALMGTSLWFVNFTHEMRNYIFMVMFVVLLLLIYHRIMAWRREPGIGAFAALAVITGLLINTHFFACLAAGVVGIWHLWQLIRKRPNRRWWGVMAAWVISGLMIIPWLLNLPTAAALAISEPRVQPNLALLLEIVRDSLFTLSNGSLALLALLLAFSLLARRSRWIWLLALLLFPLNLAAYYAFSLNEPRYNLAMLPLLALLAGFGVNELAKRRIPPALICGIWLLGFFAVEGNFQVERMLQRWPVQMIREMAAVLSPHVSSEDVIINLLGNEDRPTLALTPLVHYMGSFGARLEVVENSTFPGTQIFARRVQEAVGDADRVWLVHDPRWEMKEWALFEYLLNQQDLYHCATLVESDNMLVWGFGRVNSSSQSWQFGDGVQVSVLSEPRINEEALQVWLGFEIAPEVPGNTYSTALHLLDETRQLRAQVDAPLPEAGKSCRYEEIPVTGLAAGEYALHLAVYNWQSGERLPSADTNGETDYPLLEMISTASP